MGRKCDTVRRCGNEATVLSSLTSKLVATIFSSLASKPVATVFSGLALKSVATVSSDLTSKSVVGFLIEPQNQVGGFPGLDLKTGNDSLVICAQNHHDDFLFCAQTLICRLRYKTDRRTTA
jgi:hypothetical protein